MAAPRFITVTANPAIDNNYTISGFEAGEVWRPERTRVTPGGKGINVARVLKTLGADVIATGYLGGAGGNRILSMLGREGIEGRFVDISPEETRQAIVVIDPSSGRQTVINETGPTLSHDRLGALIARLGELTRAGDTVVFSGSVPPGIPSSSYASLIRQMNSTQATTLLDASGELLLAGAACRPTILKVNRNEIRALGVDITDWRRDVAEAARQVRTRFRLETVAITAGGEGAAIAGADDRVYLAVLPQIKVVSAVGSGDAFAAGLVCALAEAPQDLPFALRFAAACGAANALSEGAGYCTREQIKSLSGKISIDRLV